MNYEENFSFIESKWQKAWAQKKAFEPAVDKKRKKYFATVPYPYTSGPLHIGHGRTYTIADIFVRFQRMQGLNVLWPMAFHISGTPILAVSKRIAQKDAEALKTYSDYVGLYETNPEIVKQIMGSFSDPQKVADYFASVIIHDFRSLGFSIDWSRRFTTGDPEYNKFIEWQFHRLRELDLITKGTHPVLYCVNDKNAVGEDDIQNGDTIEAGIEEYVLIKFKFGNAHLVAATLRPDTIYGATNVFVNPNVIYVKFKVAHEEWIGSKEFFEKLSYQGKHPEKVGTVSGFDLIGKNCIAPLTWKEIPILPAEFPSPEIGSGIVYSVPAHSVADYAALEDLKKSSGSVKKYNIDYFTIQKIEPIPVIKTPEFGELPARDLYAKFGIKTQMDEKLPGATKELYAKEFHFGVMLNNCGDFSGMKVSDGREAIKKKLFENKLAETFHEVTANEVPVKCRCGGKVVVSLLKDQWYINYGDEGWKENAAECLKKMLILPEMYRPLFEHTINWLHERACARMRGLGTKLPWDQKWIIESLSDSTIYLAFYTIKNLIQKYKIKPEQLTRKAFDHIFEGAHTVGEVSKESGIAKKTIEEMRKSFEYWYPVDLRHTAVGHITNHLTFYIFNHVALFRKKYWPKAITLNEFLILEGAKMSKSKGNVVPLVEIPRKYGADLYRLYTVSGANLDAVVDWREKNVVSAQKRLNRFYEIAEEILGQKPKAKSQKPRTIDLWLKSRFNSVLKLATADLKNFRMRDYSQRAFFEFLNDLSYYYQRSKGSLDYALLKKILADWLKVLSPVIPHTAEEFWSKLGNKTLISLEKWPAADEKAISADVELAEELIQGTYRDIEQIIVLTENKKPKKISVIVAPQWKYEVYNGVLAGRQIKDFMQQPELRRFGNEIATYFNKVTAKKFELRKEVLDSAQELKILAEAQEFFENSFNCKFEIFAGDKSANPKAKVADVMKPGIYLE